MFRRKRNPERTFDDTSPYSYYSTEDDKPGRYMGRSSGDCPTPHRGKPTMSTFDSTQQDLKDLGDVPTISTSDRLYPALVRQGYVTREELPDGRWQYSLSDKGRGAVAA